MSASDNLFLLIKSLSRSEKREFKLLAGRYRNSSSRLAIRLFDIIDKLNEFDETVIIKKLKISNSSSVYPPMKVYLHNLIMRILRNGIVDTSNQMILTQLIQDIYIYEERGLNALLSKTIKRAIHLAREMEGLHIEALLIDLDCRFKLEHDFKLGKDFLKGMESQEIQILSSQKQEIQLRHLFYRLWMHYKLHRKSKSKDITLIVTEVEDMVSFFKEETVTGFKPTWYYLRIHSLLASIQDNKVEGLRYCQLMIDLFDLHPNHKDDHFPSYRSALVNFLVASHRLHHYEDFPPILKRLYEIVGTTDRERALLFSDITFYEILYLMNTHQFEKIVHTIPNVEANITRYTPLLSESRVLSFYNNIAIACFLCHDFSTALTYVGKVNNFGTELRNDILRSVSLLEILIHFELRNISVVTYKSRNLLRELKSRGLDAALEQKSMKYLRQLMRSTSRATTQRIYQAYLKEIEMVYARDPEKAPVFCDELLIWLRSKEV